MNVLFWILQVLLAFHTAVGAMWKLSNSAQSVPSLAAIPQSAWMALSVVELLCALALLLPALKQGLGKLIPAAALSMAAEMLLFCVVSLAAGGGSPGELIYWLVVAAFCAFIAYGRLMLKPIHSPGKTH